MTADAPEAANLPLPSTGLVMWEHRGRGGRRCGRRTAVIAGVLAIALCGPQSPGAHADTPTQTSDRLAAALNFPWPDLLPAFPTTSNPQPGPVPGCQEPTPGCIGLEITRLRDLRRRLGCDHRAVFATTYLVLTLTLRGTLRANPRFFADPAYLYTEDALFADYYFRTVADYARGRPVPAAWRIAFRTAARGRGARHRERVNRRGGGAQPRGGRGAGLARPPRRLLRPSRAALARPPAPQDARARGRAGRRVEHGGRHPLGVDRVGAVGDG